MLRVLIVEDDEALRDSLVLLLRQAGHEVSDAGSAAAARPLLGSVELLLTDLRLPDELGTALLLDAQKVNPRLQVIIMTGYATVQSAIAATRSGARDYLLKPFEMGDLKRQVDEVDKLCALQHQATRWPGGLVAASAPLQRVLATIEVAAAASAPVLIEGETGTGKDLVARAIHQRSSRREQPLIAINLAALPRELVESELFGYERGAFTSAVTSRQGRFTLAGKGTIFLDELNSLPLEVQPKLLRALETREIWPVGAERPLPIQARIIAACNQPLAELVEQGRFRADLYYRLNVLHIDIPPLRERLADIPLLVRALLDRSDIPRGSPAPIEIAPDALEWLVAHPWPGNVRELKNFIERSLLQSTALQRRPPRLERQDLTPMETLQKVLPFKEAQSAATDSWSRAVIVAALQKADGNRAQAAKLLQMNRTALFKLMKKLDIHD